MTDEAIHLSYLKWGLITYRREYGHYPDSHESADLARYTAGQSAFDVWGNKKFHTKTAYGFEICSAGPDGTFETNDDMALEHSADKQSIPQPHAANRAKRLRLTSRVRAT